MPKSNAQGGNKSKGKKKNTTSSSKKRDIEVPSEEDDSHVAIVTKNNGDNRFNCTLISDKGIDPKVYIAHLSPSTKKKAGGIIMPGAYIMISLRSFQSDKTKCDIIFVYRDSEISYLIENNYINNVSSVKKDGNNEIDIEFSNSNNMNSEQNNNEINIDQI